MGFSEQLGDGGHTYRRVKIVRKPGHLTALNADRLHSTSVKVGPVVEDSEISFTGDDHLNILARMLVVCKPSGLVGPVSSFAVLDVAGVGLQLGDELSFYKLLAGKHPELNVT